MREEWMLVGVSNEVLHFMSINDHLDKINFLESCKTSIHYLMTILNWFLRLSFIILLTKSPVSLDFFSIILPISLSRFIDVRFLSVSLPWLHPLDWILLLLCFFFIYSINDISELVGGYWVYLWFCLRSCWLIKSCLSLSFFWSTPIYIRIEYSRIHNEKWMIVIEDFRWNRQKIFGNFGGVFWGMWS